MPSAIEIPLPLIESRIHASAGNNPAIRSPVVRIVSFVNESKSFAIDHPVRVADSVNSKSAALDTDATTRVILSPATKVFAAVAFAS